MTPSELLASQSDLIGEQVELSGYLISDEETYVVESKLSVASSVRVSLPHVSVQSALLENLPCFVGGPALFKDRCRVQGVLTATDGYLVLVPHTIEIFRPARPPHVVTIAFD